MDISVIIVNTHDEHDLQTCLSSLAKSSTTKKWEVVVVNNGYESNLDALREQYANISIRVTHTEQNKGYGVACNKGAEVATGTLLVFSNPDITYNTETLDSIVLHFETHPNTGAASPLLLLPPNDTVQPFSFGKEVTPWRVLTRKFLPTEQELLNRIAPDCTKVDWVAGAVLIIPKSLFKKIHGFDERFFLYFEDNDLCKRIKNEGRDIVLLHWTPVHHTGHQGESGKTTRKENTKHKKLYYESQKRYIRKHYCFCAYIMILVFQKIYMIGK